ncbi:MAG: hypothetical protein K8F25_01030 [Fimbriimonadaceae bacterium]|nr:hypothetical protein [Alphaproteobacteria bacterium]
MFSNASLLVLLLPLVCVNVIEAFTHLWLRTAGTLGLGGLVVFVPMLIAGALVGSGLLIAFRVIEPFDPSLPRYSESLTAWVVLALICAAITIALWRYWPEPRARLF